MILKIHFHKPLLWMMESYMDTISFFHRWYRFRYFTWELFFLFDWFKVNLEKVSQRVCCKFVLYIQASNKWGSGLTKDLVLVPDGQDFLGFSSAWFCKLCDFPSLCSECCFFNNVCIWHKTVCWVLWGVSCQRAFRTSGDMIYRWTKTIITESCVTAISV